MQAELQTLESSGAKKPKLARVDTRLDGADPPQGGKDGGKRDPKGNKGSGKSTESNSRSACIIGLPRKVARGERSVTTFRKPLMLEAGVSCVAP